MNPTFFQYFDARTQKNTLSGQCAALSSSTCPEMLLSSWYLQHTQVNLEQTPAEGLGSAGSSDSSLTAEHAVLSRRFRTSSSTHDEQFFNWDRRNATCVIPTMATPRQYRAVQISPLTGYCDYIKEQLIVCTLNEPYSVFTCVLPHTGDPIRHVWSAITCKAQQWHRNVCSKFYNAANLTKGT